MDLERPSDLEILRADVQGFLEGNPRRLVFDEAQRFPDLLPALRVAIDDGSGAGRFVLTGSSSPRLRRGVSETLAGRVGIVELGPFTSRELAPVGRVRDRWFWGGFPPVHRLRGRRARLEWLDSYVSTFLERDIPAVGMRLPSVRLRQLFTMLTHVHGSLLNVSDLARSIGVSVHTIEGDLDVLEAAFMIRRLVPHHASVKKRLTKSPKVYVRDSGLLHFLAGLRRPVDLETWPRRGHSFEGLVIEELISLSRERLVRPEPSFWRTQAGAEVDLLLQDGRHLVPIEIKLGSAIDPRGLAGLRQCMEDLHTSHGYVVTGGGVRTRLGGGIEIVPFAEVIAGRETFGLR